MTILPFSRSNDVALNLAREEYVVRNFRDGDLLFFYRNNPAVVVGKHQNVFEESNTSLLLERDIPLARRISGGGAVYHDPGNLNFVLITDHVPALHNAYEPFLRPVISLLSRYGVEAALNNRNSLVLNDGRKISGNAQFASRGRMISHGTLLFSSDLQLLQEILTPDTPVLTSRAVPSVRSRVVNLQEVLPASVTLDELEMELAGQFCREFRSGEGSERSDPVEYAIDADVDAEIELLAGEKYRNWNWTIGRSPFFTMQIRDRLDRRFELAVRNGCIESVKFNSPETSDVQLDDPQISRFIVGRSVHPAELRQIITELSELDFG